MIREPILSNVPQVRRGLVRLLLLVRGEAPVNLLDELDAMSTGRGPVCGVDAILRGLTDKERAEWVEAIDRQGVPGIWKYAATDIAKALAKRGHNIRSETIQRHRRRNCKCQ